MAVFSDEAFNNLCVPIYKEEDVLEKYKYDLKKIFGGLFKHRRVDLEKLVKYVIYMYDLSSPMRELFTDMSIRKTECAMLAGYDIKKDEKRLERIYILEDRDIVEMISSYLKFQNHKTWAMLTTNEEVLWQYQKELLQPITEFKQDKEKLQALDIKSKLMNESDSIINRIKNYEDKIFGDNKEVQSKLKQAKTSPETIAYVHKN